MLKFPEGNCFLDFSFDPLFLALDGLFEFCRVQVPHVKIGRCLSRPEFRLDLLVPVPVRTIGTSGVLQKKG